jgi:hypothetical protein
MPIGAQTSAADYIAALRKPQQVRADTGYGGLGGFIASALSAAGPEFVGLGDKEADLLRWEGQHPIANVASDLLGFGAAYTGLTAVTGGMGGIGALGRIPRVAKAAQRGLGRLTASGTVAGKLGAAGATEILRFAPVEAARLGLATAVGDPGTVAGHLPVNMLAIGGIGAGIKAAKMAFPFNSPMLRSEGLIADLHPEYRAFARNQTRLDQLYALKARDAAEGKLTPEISNAYRTAIEGMPAQGGTEYPGLQQIILNEVPESGKRAAVRQLTVEGRPKKLNELFKITPLKSGKWFTSRFLHHGKDGVPKSPKGVAALEDALAQLPEGHLAHMQYPRLIDTAKVAGVTSKDAQKLAATRWQKVENVFAEGERIGDLSYYKELESGMFVALKRTGDTSGVIFKTDHLGFFEPAAANAPKAMGKELWATGPEYAIGTVLKDLGPVTGDIQRMMKSYPRYMDITGRTPGETLEKLASALNPESRLQAKRATRFFRETFKKGFAPWLHMTSSSPQAVRLSSMGRHMSNVFHAEAMREFGGKVTQEILESIARSGKGAPIKHILGKAIATKGGIHEKTKNLTDKDLSQFWSILLKATKAEELSAKEFSPELIQFVKALQRLDAKTVKRLMAVQKWTGAHDFTPLTRHMMMSRMWTGAFRVKVVDANGRILGMGSGTSKGAAIADAEAVAARANQLMAETGSINVARTPQARNLQDVHRDLRTDQTLAPTTKGWTYDSTARAGESIYDFTGPGAQSGAVIVRRTSSPRGKVVFEATVAEGPPTLGKYASPKEAAEVVENFLSGKTPKGPIEAQSWEVLIHNHEEDLQMALDGAGLSANKRAIEAMDRAFEESFKKKTARWEERKGAIGFQHYHKPLKREEIDEMVLGNLITSYRYMSREVRDKLFASEMAHLDMVNPSMSREVQKRFARLDGVSGPMTKQLNKAFDAAFAPILGPKGATRISGALTNAMFRLTLTAGDIGFPAVNAVTFLQTVYPEVAMLRDLPAEALQHMYSYSLVGTKRGLQGVAHASPIKITNEAWRQLFSASTNKNKTLQEAIQRASEHNVVNPRFVEEYLGKLREDVSLTRANMSENFVDFIKAADSYMAGKSEQTSRLHAFLTGRIVGDMIFPGLSEDALFNFAREFTERTMFLYNSSGRATAFTGPIGSAVGLFKNWSLHYLGNLSGYMGAGFRYGHWKPLAYSMMGTGTIAGMGGIPLYGLADGVSRVLSDDSLMNNLYDWMGYSDQEPLVQRGIDSIYYGLPAWAGITFQGRAEAPSSHIARDLNQLGSMMMLDRAAQSIAAVGEAWETWEATGQNPFRNPRVRSQAARAFLPRTLYRSMQRTAQGAIRSLATGSPLISDVSLGEHVWYSLGVTSTDIQRKRDVNNHYYNDEVELQTMISRFGQMSAAALVEGDFERFRELRRQAIFSHNLPVDRLVRSEMAAKQHLLRRDSMSQRDIRSQAEARRIYGQ